MADSQGVGVTCLRCDRDARQGSKWCSDKCHLKSVVFENKKLRRRLREEAAKVALYQNEQHAVGPWPRGKAAVEWMAAAKPEVQVRPEGPPGEGSANGEVSGA